MSRFTREQRQKIVREFAEQHDGWFDAGAFLSEVRQVGKVHPAYEWFEWNDEKAAHEHRLDQARDFARGLIVRFEVETIERGDIKVVTRDVPMVISPMERRGAGGGYRLTDPNDPQHMGEHCRQAAQSMRWFISRYEAAVICAGGDMTVLTELRDQLERAGAVADVAA
ncbi:hypothetical protein [Sphingomonas sp.]|uniref:hypothetical protein n=1 Tax=Sphingomonas sp. TaxID=28214 RepID=UPI003BAB432C